MAYVQFSDDSHTVVISVFNSPQDSDSYPNQAEIPDDDPRYIYYIEAPLRNQIRQQRDSLLASVVDIGTAIIQRSIRLQSAPLDKLNAKQAEIDAYAEALQAVPQQSGFPHSIVWPTQPTKEI